MIRKRKLRSFSIALRNLHKSPQIIDQKFKCELNISNMFWRQLWFEKSRVTMLTLHQELEAFDEQDLRFDLVLWNSNLCFCNRLHHLIFHVTFQTNHLQLFNWSYLNHLIIEDIENSLIQYPTENEIFDDFINSWIYQIICKETIHL